MSHPAFIAVVVVVVAAAAPITSPGPTSSVALSAVVRAVILISTAFIPITFAAPRVLSIIPTSIAPLTAIVVPTAIVPSVIVPSVIIVPSAIFPSVIVPALVLDTRSIDTIFSTAVPLIAAELLTAHSTDDVFALTNTCPCTLYVSASNLCNTAVVRLTSANDVVSLRRHATMC